MAVAGGYLGVIPGGSPAFFMRGGRACSCSGAGCSCTLAGMLMVVSPAKSLEMGIPLPPGSPSATEPRLSDQSTKLIAAARKLSVKKLMALMDISQALAEQNRERYAAWGPDHSPAKAHPAIMVFRGDVYQGLAAENMDAALIERAQAHLRILSGLYGVLRPLDLIQPYRLEMGRALKVGRAANLYAFWKTAPTDLLVQDMEAAGTSYLLNLASEEYFKVVQPNALPAGSQIVSPQFLDQVKDGYRPMGFFSKRARGLLARWVLEHGAESPAALSDFAVEGYRFVKKDSTAERPVFRRAEKDRPEISLPRAPKGGKAKSPAAQ